MDDITELKNACVILKDRICALELKLIDTEAALAWYGSQENWRAMKIHSDKGQKARDFLRKGRPEF